MADEFNHFYRNLLGTSCLVQPIDSGILTRGHVVSLEQISSLVRDISRQEIKEALFSIGDDKSQGPDVFILLFKEVLGDHWE